MFGTCVRVLSAALSGAAVITALIGGPLGVEYAVPVSLALYVASVVAMLGVRCQGRWREEARDVRDWPSARKGRPIREPGE